MNVDDLSKLHNTQAEVQVLAAILFNPYLYEPLSEHLSAEIFNDKDCQETYEEGDPSAPYTEKKEELPF